MFQEVKYIFKYDKFMPVESTVHVYVDPVENRRYWFEQDSYLKNFRDPLRNPLNYKGTGVKETQVIYPEIVYEMEINRDGVVNDNIHRIIYYLPDVDAYAVASYSERQEGDEPKTAGLGVRLLDKLPKDSTEQ